MSANVLNGRCPSFRVESFVYYDVSGMKQSDFHGCLTRGIDYRICFSLSSLARATSVRAYVHRHAANRGRISTFAQHIVARGRERHENSTCPAECRADSSVSRYGILIAGYWSPGLRYFERT